MERQGQDVRYSIADFKLRALGWTPKAVFDDELKKIVDYYKNNFIW
jgi:dTDP-D-glucose 4,6-dehydratase